MLEAALFSCLTGWNFLPSQILRLRSIEMVRRWPHGRSRRDPSWSQIPIMGPGNRVRFLPITYVRPEYGSQRVSSGGYPRSRPSWMGWFQQASLEPFYDVVQFQRCIKKPDSRIPIRTSTKQSPFSFGSLKVPENSNFESTTKCGTYSSIRTIVRRHRKLIKER